MSVYLARRDIARMFGLWYHTVLIHATCVPFFGKIPQVAWGLAKFTLGKLGGACYRQLAPTDSATPHPMPQRGTSPRTTFPPAPRPWTPAPYRGTGHAFDRRRDDSGGRFRTNRSSRLAPPHQDMNMGDFRGKRLGVVGAPSLPSGFPPAIGGYRTYLRGNDECGGCFSSNLCLA